MLQILPDLHPATLPDDGAVITAARVDGLTLHLTLQFAGGCHDHRFAVVAGTAFGKSLPPYTVLQVAHDGQRDPCEALLERSVAVDLSPLVPLLQQMGTHTLRFELAEPGGRHSAVGELRFSF